MLHGSCAGEAFPAIRCKLYPISAAAGTGNMSHVTKLLATCGSEGDASHLAERGLGGKGDAGRLPEISSTGCLQITKEMKLS